MNANGQLFQKRSIILCLVIFTKLTITTIKINPQKYERNKNMNTILLIMFLHIIISVVFVFSQTSSTICLRSHGLLYFLWIVVPKTFFVITEHTFQEKRDEKRKKNLDADDHLHCKGQKYISLYIMPNNTLLCSRKGANNACNDSCQNQPMFGLTNS